ncbi:MAG: 30S ribosomal protein S3ae [Candidatus Micrarchaeota archaeon]|nr:30S ribosomal protein S3ae [Candidatus Micrarchaeota archaeon]
MAKSDKFKLKSWYGVVAPAIFDEKKIGDIVGFDDESVLGRVIIANLAELTGEMPHSYTRINLKVKDIKGKTAYTRLIGHELLRSYLRTIVRRRMSLVDDVVKVRTKDGVDVAVKTAIVTANRVSQPTRVMLRKIAEEIIRDKASKSDYDSFMQEVLFRKLASAIYTKVKVIVPIKRVEIIKTELIEQKKKAEKGAESAAPAEAQGEEPSVA